MNFDICIQDVNSFNFPKCPTLFVPILQMWKLRQSETQIPTACLHPVHACLGDPHIKRVAGRVPVKTVEDSTPEPFIFFEKLLFSPLPEESPPWRARE